MMSQRWRCNRTKAWRTKAWRDTHKATKCVEPGSAGHRAPGAANSTDGQRSSTDRRFGKKLVADVPDTHRYARFDVEGLDDQGLVGASARRHECNDRRRADAGGCSAGSP